MHCLLSVLKGFLLSETVTFHLGQRSRRPEINWSLKLQPSEVCLGHFRGGAGVPAWLNRLVRVGMCGWTGPPEFTAAPPVWSGNLSGKGGRANLVCTPEGSERVRQTEEQLQLSCSTLLGHRGAGGRPRGYFKHNQASPDVLLPGMTC